MELLTFSTDVLIISPDNRLRATLLSTIADGGWTVHHTPDAGEAIALLQRTSIRVVIAGGEWREILDFTRSLARPPCVIVTVPFADELLWAEVLNLGGYDMIAQPLDPNEIIRIVGAGCRRFRTALAAG